MRRSVRRDALVVTEQPVEETEEAKAELFHPQIRQEELDMQALLATFAAPEVVDAYYKSLAADRAAYEQHGTWRRAARKLQGLRPDSTPVAGEVERLAKEESDAVLKAFGAALIDAVHADSVLQQAVRDDLEKEPDGTAPGRSVSLFRPSNTGAEPASARFGRRANYVGGALRLVRPPSRTAGPAIPGPGSASSSSVSGPLLASSRTAFPFQPVSSAWSR